MEEPDEVVIEVIEEPDVLVDVDTGLRRSDGPGYVYVLQSVPPQPPIITHTEQFQDGNCEVTRSHWSHGRIEDDRTCLRTRQLQPHEFLADWMRQRFDRDRGWEMEEEDEERVVVVD